MILRSALASTECDPFHTHADREWAHDRESGIGRLAKGFDEAIARGWTVVDMKHDWKRVFPFEAAATRCD